MRELPDTGAGDALKGAPRAVKDTPFPPLGFQCRGTFSVPRDDSRRDTDFASG